MLRIILSGILLLVSAAPADGQREIAEDAGLQWEANGNFDRAEQVYRKELADSASPQEQAIRRAFLVHLLLRRGRAEACSHLPALRATAKDPIPLLVLAGAERACRGPQFAIPYFQRALEIADPGLAPQVAMNLTIVLGETGRHQDVIQLWGHWRSHVQVGGFAGEIAYARALAHLGAATKAREAMSNAIIALEFVSLTPEERAQAFSTAAQVYRMTGAKKQAKAMAGRAHAILAAIPARAVVHISELPGRR